MRREPMVLSLPPFAGVTRRLILTAAGVYLALLVGGLFSHAISNLVAGLLALHPDQALTRCVWQFFTYPFVDPSLLSLLFALLSFWFFGSALESERGGLWLGEYFVASTAGGGLLGTILSRTVFTHVPDLAPQQDTYTMWSAVLALIVAFAVFHPDQELSFNFLFRVKAKYLAAIYMLVYLALSISGGARFSALVTVLSAVCGFLYIRSAPRHGLRFAATERWYGLRNAMYRRKRARAARKFQVYMKEQGRDVHFDESGKYIPPEEDRGRSNHNHWVN